MEIYKEEYEEGKDEENKEDTMVMVYTTKFCLYKEHVDIK